MQDWQNTGQGPPQGQGQVWQSDFGFGDETAHFNDVPGWSQAIPGQGGYGNINDRAGQGSPSIYTSTHQAPITHAAGGPGSSSSLGQTAYQSQFSVDDRFGQPGQPGQSLQSLGYAQDVYGQQGNHAQFSQAGFQYPNQNPAAFSSHVQQQQPPQQQQQQQQQQHQYSDPQLLTQQRRNPSLPPLAQQRFEPLQQSNFQHEFAQGLRPMPSQPQQDPHRVARPNNGFAGSPLQYNAQHLTPQTSQGFLTSGLESFRPPSPSPADYQQQQQQQQQLQQQQQQQPKLPLPVAHHNSAPFQTVPAGQQLSHSAHQTLHAVPQPASQPSQFTTQQANTVPTSTTPILPAEPESAPAPKKQKRPAKKDTDKDLPIPPREPSAGSGAPAVTTQPFSTQEEAAAVAQFKTRPATAKKTFPSVQGAPFLVSSGSVTLPFAKSYDRISPLVALPSQSGRRVLPSISHDLPCEIQGRFAVKYRPSANFTGTPEDREKEAKPLIDEYQRDMKALGNRKPKYADYPFFYQEQLKADEAAKTKAQRKLKKEEEEERKKPIRPAERPTDPVEGAAWDILGIVHIPASAARTHSLIGDAVRKLGDFLIKLRGEMTKAKAEVDEEAKASTPDAGKLAKLKKDFETKKEAIIRACEAADKHGDEAVLENLGGNQKGCLSLVNSLITCLKAQDYSGKLPKAILRFMSNISMPQKVAEAVKFETVRKRYADKGDDEVKALIRTVASRIKKETEQANGASEAKKPATTASAANATSTKLKAPAASNAATAGGTRLASDSSPTKRPLEDDSDSRPGKKVNTDGSSSTLASKLGAGKTTAPNTLQSKLAPPRVRPVTSSLAAKNRPTVKPVVKQDPAKSEPSKPDAGTNSTPMDVDQPTARRLKLDAARATPAKSAPSSSSLSSIGSLLDSINTRKPDTQATKKEVSKHEPNETPEQRAKRLRKESRRSLRVTWKPEHELTQIRVFHKEAAEDENNMTQDAADDRSEGMMLKRRLTDEDDEEEDDLPTQNDPWVTPKAADVSHIEQEYRDKTFATRGGTIEVHTDEQKAMEQREQNVLMVVYTSPEDIPPTPKSPTIEPSQPSSDDAIVARLPKDVTQYDEMQTRLLESQQYGPESATWSAKRRREAKSHPAAKLQSIFDGMQPSTSAEAIPEGYNYNMTPPQKHAQLAQLHAANSGNAQFSIPPPDHTLALLQSDAVKNWRSPAPYNPMTPSTYRRSDYPDPGFQAVANQVEDVFEGYKGLPHPPSEPPKWLTDPERIREWQAGYQQELVVRAQRQDKARAEAEASAQRPRVESAQHQDAWAAYFQQQQAQQQQAQQQQEDPYAKYVELYQRMQNGQAQPNPQAPATGAGGQPSQLGEDQVQALLAQINQPQQSQQSNAYNLNPNDQGYSQLMMLAQLQQPASQGHDQWSATRSQPGELDYGEPYDGRGHDFGYEYGSGNGRDREADRDGDWEHRERRDSRERQDQQDGRRDKQDKHGKGRKGNAPGGATLPPHRPANKALIGTKPCVFWQQGKCARGDKCTFRHDN